MHGHPQAVEPAACGHPSRAPGQHRQRLRRRLRRAQGGAPGEAACLVKPDRRAVIGTIGRTSEAPPDPGSSYSRAFASSKARPSCQQAISVICRSRFSASLRSRACPTLARSGGPVGAAALIPERHLSIRLRDHHRMGGDGHHHHARLGAARPQRSRCLAPMSFSWPASACWCWDAPAAWPRPPRCKRNCSSPRSVTCCAGAAASLVGVECLLFRLQLCRRPRGGLGEGGRPASGTRDKGIFPLPSAAGRPHRLPGRCRGLMKALWLFGGMLVVSNGIIGVLLLRHAAAP